MCVNPVPHGAKKVFNMHKKSIVYHFSFYHCMNSLFVPLIKNLDMLSEKQTKRKMSSTLCSVNPAFSGFHPAWAEPVVPGDVLEQPESFLKILMCCKGGPF